MKFELQLGQYLSREAIIEHDRGDWLVMLNDGAVHVRRSARAALRLVKRWDRAASARDNCSVITIIEWRNVPQGFVEPEEE
jgi:hypothetical protein